MTAPVVTITHDMPLAQQVRLLDEGRAAGSIIIFVPSQDEADDLQDYADSHGDPGYHARYTADLADREYVRQTDGHSVTTQEWMR